MRLKVLVIYTALLWASTGALAGSVDPSNTQARGALIKAHMEACRGLAEGKAMNYPESERGSAYEAHYSVCLYARGYVDGQVELRGQSDALATYDSI